MDYNNVFLCLFMFMKFSCLSPCKRINVTKISCIIDQRLIGLSQCWLLNNSKENIISSVRLIG